MINTAYVHIVRNYQKCKTSDDDVIWDVTVNH